MDSNYFNSLEYTPKLIALLSDIDNSVITDFGGGSPLPKTFIMAKLALMFKIKNYVEIGVYRGKSFLQLAKVMDYLGGKSYGIDPFSLEYAQENDVAQQIKTSLDEFLKSLDFEKIYNDVLEKLITLNIKETSKIIRKPSWMAVEDLKGENVTIDMLHIDGNHDEKIVNKDVDQYFPLVAVGGFIILDDIDWPSVHKVYEKLIPMATVIFDNGYFAILVKEHKKSSAYDPLIRKLLIQYSMIEQIQAVTQKQENGQENVSIIVTSFNHEDYIADCLEGIFAQKGNFVTQLVIGDDNSVDNTLRIIDDYLEMIRDNVNFRITKFDARENLGITKNLHRCLKLCTGNYVAICEGDDYWIDPLKIKKQVDFLQTHTECSMCFNNLLIEMDGQFKLFEPQQKSIQLSVSTTEIIKNNIIGNFSTCLYNAKYLERIPEGLFELFTVDWMFNIYYSLFGPLGHLCEVMSVYRKHAEGSWSGKSSVQQGKLLEKYIDDYDAFLNYEFDPEFQFAQDQSREYLFSVGCEKMTDLTIIDDVFPHPLSAFRYQEYLSYLQSFPNIEILCSGMSFKAFGNDTLEEKLIEFKRLYPQFAGKVRKYNPELPINTRLIYMLFLENTFVNIEKIERLNIPFVFTLYPGGGFGLNNKKSDDHLRRVFSSPNFKKVIVTQKVTYDYLVNKNFCRPEKIQMVFGVVTPLKRLQEPYQKKKRYGFEKNDLDICFVAHKYTKGGIDKGFDIFIAVAKILTKKYSNIFFHVVGGFSQGDADLTGLEKKIHFYGNQSSNWFDSFYEDKDIILSPNIPGMIYTGSFDGFPTASCTDAGLREVAIFCTDMLGLNHLFSEGEDIVIIPHESLQISRKIEEYYHAPESLRNIAINGAQKIRELYDFSHQIQPRIELLQNEITLADNELSKKRRSIEEDGVNQKNGLRDFLAKFSPRFFKRWLTRLLNFVLSHSKLGKFLKKLIPQKILNTLKKDPFFSGNVQKFKEMQITKNKPQE